MVRISTFQVNQQGVADLQRIGAAASDAQRQISSGQRINRPSDDPIGAAQIVELRRRIDAREDFINNTFAVEDALSLEEGVLSRVIENLQRVRELLLQAGNGVLSFQDQQFLAAEIESRFDELLSLANAQGPDGQFLFAGNNGSTTPFEADGLEIRYQGDDGQQLLQIDFGQFVPISDSGRRVFVDVPTTGANFEVSEHPGNDRSAAARIHRESVSDPEALAEFFPDDLIVRFEDPSEAGGENNFSVVRRSDGRVVDGLENVVFNPGVAIEAAGTRFSISGSPTAGDQFFIEATNTQGVLTTVQDVAQGLRNVDPAAEPENFRQLIDGNVANLNASIDRVLEVQADIGARLNAAQSTRVFQEGQNLETTEALSDVRDLDFAEAVSRLSFQSFLLQAAQQSFARVSRLSLFNVL